jgi:hypothetical protein
MAYMEVLRSDDTGGPNARATAVDLYDPAGLSNPASQPDNTLEVGKSKAA